KYGIVFAVVGTNLNNGDRLQQTSTINITAPANALNPRLTSDVDTITAGKTVKIYAAVKDEMGINTAAGTPMRLSLNEEAIDAGVKLNAEWVVIQGNGSVSIDLIVPQGVTTDTLKSIVVTGTIRDPRGNEIATKLTFVLQDVTNPYTLTINSSKDWLSVDGDKAIITVYAKNISTGKAAANQIITLKVKKTNSTIGRSVGIVNEEEGDNGIVDTYTVTTDQQGNGFFTLLIPTDTMEDGKDALIASGIELEASLIDPINQVTTSQIYRLGVNEPANTNPRYSLRIASAKPTLDVRSDSTAVTVTLLDQNGGGVANKYVTLGINKFIENGATIVGASGLTTDEKGQATFMVKVDETARHQTYSALKFISEDLELFASFSDAETISTPNVILNKTLNVFKIDVIPSPDEEEQPEGHLTFGRSAELEKSDGTYYTESM